MSDTTDHLSKDVSDMLAALRAAQENAPPVAVLVGVVGEALQRKNELISILAEPVLASDCACSGCVQMREIICNELEIRMVHIVLDPETVAKCVNTVQ